MNEMLMVLLSGTMIIFLIRYLIRSIGWAMIFKKCGVEKFWAYIPVLRDYKIAQCAGKEDEGFVWIFSDFSLIFWCIVYELMTGTDHHITSMSIYIVLIIRLVFFVVRTVYEVKVFAGVCHLFGRKKFWLIGWELLRVPTALYWGFSKKFVPKHKLGENEKIAAALSGGYEEVLERGLTINITDSTVHEFLKKHVLLRDIHMSIKPGRMVLLLGGSGAGKTTFLNAVTGYEKANAQIHLDGEDIYHNFNNMKYQIGFVPQMDLIRYQDTVYNTLMDAATLRLPVNTSKKQRQERVKEVMDIFGLAPVKDHMVGKQSGGQKKRISIASEFISDPSLYILDEPDSGLDGILAKDLMRRLHELSRQDKIVIVITHTPDRVLEYFDDVIVLAKDHDHVGRLVFYGEIEEAKKFFGKDTMEDVVKMINRVEEGGEGKADELIEKFGGMANG